MSTEKTFDPFVHLPQYRHYLSVPQNPLKRKCDSLDSSVQDRVKCYPSPPMSSPPSPPLPAPELSITTTSGSAQTIAAEATLVTTAEPSQPAAEPQFQPAQVTQQPIPGSAPLLLPPPPPEPPRTQLPAFGILQTGPVTSAPQALSGEATAAARPATRTGRKSKAHVASACMNCKRAHLSCDVQRPCARCIASGKQDTCFDVPHKKRGRPRLREEGEFKVQQMVPVQSTPSAIATVAGPSTARPIARTRHQRTDSLRSLRSQTSEESSAGSSLPTPGFPPPTLQAPFSYHPPPPSTGLTPAEVPTAYLDLGFQFIRVNRPFQLSIQIEQDLRGRPVADVVTPADGETFQAINNRLLAEREQREPSYMPPIMQTGQDPLQGVLEADIDRLTQGFSDRTYTWRRSQPGAPAETFPVRVRLAKAATYFVVLTLPTFRPQAAPMPAPPFGVSRPPILQPPFASPTQMATQSAPPPPYYPFPPPSMPPPQPPSLAAQSYHPPQPVTGYPPQGYQYHPQPSTPQRPAFAPSAETPRFTPESGTRPAGQPSTPAMQLPPITPAAAGPSQPQSAPMTGAEQQGRSSSDDEEEEFDEQGRRIRSPRKRRRMGISDVLQR